MFTGKELDEETGLYYFGARYYDPRTSVWQSPDPILAEYIQRVEQGGHMEYSANFALYTYVHQRPTRAIDPNGEDALDINAVIFGVTVGTDPKSGQPFKRYRIGITGVGISYDQNGGFARQNDQTEMVGDCMACDESAEMESINTGVGVAIGIGILGTSADLVEGHDEFVSVTGSDGETEYYNEYEPLLPDVLGNPDVTVGYEPSTDAKDQTGSDNRQRGGIVGLNLKLDFNYEWGTMVPWSDVNPNVESYRDPDF